MPCLGCELPADERRQETERESAEINSDCCRRYCRVCTKVLAHIVSHRVILEGYNYCV